MNLEARRLSGSERLRTRARELRARFAGLRQSEAAEALRHSLQQRVAAGFDAAPLSERAVTGIAPTNQLPEFLCKIPGDTWVSFSSNPNSDVTPHVVTVIDLEGLQTVLDASLDRLIANGQVTQEEATLRQREVLHQAAFATAVVGAEPDATAQYTVSFYRDENGQVDFTSATEVDGIGRARSFMKVFPQHQISTYNNMPTIHHDAEAAALDTRPGFNPGRTAAENDAFAHTLDSHLASASFNAQPVHYLAEEMSTRESADDSITRFHAMRDLPDDAIVRCPYKAGRNIVYVDDPADYPLLLRKAYTIAGASEDEIDRLVDETYTHEMAHYNRAVEEPKIRPLLAVEISRDIARGNYIVGPSTEFGGLVNVGAYREITSAPDALSEGDMLTLGLDRHEINRLHEEALLENEQRARAAARVLDTRPWDDLSHEPDVQAGAFTLTSPEQESIAEGEISMDGAGTAVEFIGGGRKVTELFNRDSDRREYDRDDDLER
jgi:hypothetical protein